MSKYIDAEKLLSEIDRLNFLVSYESEDRHDDGLHDAYKAVKNIITSLQQEQPQVADASKMEQEVDLKKEYKEYVEDDPVFSRLTNRNVGLAIARHFWNKGYNARNKK